MPIPLSRSNNFEDYLAKSPPMRCATPYLASRDGTVMAYRLAGIRRRGLEPTDPRYWWLEFNPEMGLGVITDSPTRLSLRRGLKIALASGAPALHFVKLIREDGAVYWEGYCTPREHELELVFVGLLGDREIAIDNGIHQVFHTRPEAVSVNRFWREVAITIVVAGIIAWAIALALIFRN